MAVYAGQWADAVTEPGASRVSSATGATSVS